MSAAPPFLKTRGAALTALGVGAILFGIVIVAPIAAAFSAQDDEIEDSLRQLGFYRAEIAAKPALEAELKSLNAQGASVPGVIDAPSTAIAQAKLQSEIKSIVEANGGSVRSMQVMASANQSGFEIVAVQSDLSVPEARLKDLATAVAAHAPYLFVDEASVSAPPREPDDPANRQATLDIRWTVHGYRWGSAK
ncbi:MAG TPA: type II secretion system protein GspM [Rhizomicrobium sp.]|nr:type II secretion system protein GspM [Rhizomicrobium sp.]